MAKKIGTNATSATGKSLKRGNRMRILAIDGGGMLGLTTAIYLKELERKLGSPLRMHFDLIAGTSTGSILAVALASGINIDRVIRLYIEKGRDIFPSGASGTVDSLGRLFTQGFSRPKHGDRGLGEALKGELVKGRQPIKFGAIETSVLVTAYDTIERRAWVFKSWRPWLRDVEAWQLVKGSCSAPTFFPAHVMGMSVPSRSRDSSGLVYKQFALIDGGVWANNPAAVALAEAHKRRRDTKAGEDSFDFEPSSVVVASFGNIDSPQEAISARSAREWGAIEWVKRGDLIGVMMDGSQETAAYIAGALAPPGRTHRISCVVEGPEDYEMDDASPEALERLEALAQLHIEQPGVQAALDSLVGQLK